MGLLDNAGWRSKIFIGEWTKGAGGDAPVVEPATGEELHGFAKANEQRRLLNGTSESAAAKRLDSGDF